MEDPNQAARKQMPSTLDGKLRACLSCAQIKTQHAFRKEGCENCPMLKMKGNMGVVNECTSSKFQGVIGLLDPKKSWVARWQRASEFKPGLYAMTVEGVLADDHIQDVEQGGRYYYEREKSFKL
jgi:transcription elongation factor SPT4